MIYLFGAALCACAFFVWEAVRLVRRRNDAARRHDRRNTGIAKQKAWDLVFGRRAQRRLSFDPSERPED